MLGFVFAVSYEGMFFYSLSIELNQILAFADIVEASALKILPSIPLLFLMLSFATSDFLSESEENRQTNRSLLRYLKFAYGVFVVVFAALFVLFGFEANLGFACSALIAMYFFLRFIVSPALRNKDIQIYRAILIFLFFTLTFVFIGFSDARTARFGDRSALPRVTTDVIIPEADHTDYRFVRALSSGILLATEARDKMWFVRHDNSTILTFYISPTPFRGVLCEEFEWCPFQAEQP